MALRRQWAARRVDEPGHRLTRPGITSSFPRSRPDQAIEIVRLPWFRRCGSWAAAGGIPVLAFGSGVGGNRATPAEEPTRALRVDDRRVISGILHVLKVGWRSCDCPSGYGPSTTIYKRFNRWSRRGVRTRLLEAPVDVGASREAPQSTAHSSAPTAPSSAGKEAALQRSAARAAAWPPRCTPSPTSPPATVCWCSLRATLPT